MNLTEAKQHLAAMYRIRFFEEKLIEIRKENVDIHGSIHLCNGQEAVAIGTLAALGPNDSVFATYRGHGWAIACGAPPESVFAEIMGRETGLCKGRGGSALLSAPAYRFLGENSIVGAGAPMAVGAAMTAHFKKSGAVAVTVFGDGAMNQGAIHESMNFAAFMHLPVIFVCENNTYSEMTPIADMVRDAELYKRAAAYGMPSERIDGNGPALVKATVARYVEQARAGRGPVLIEAITQRIVGHYWGEMQAYRPKGELTRLAEVEPIARLRREMLQAGETEAALEQVRAAIHAEIEQAADRARKAPLADAGTVKEHLYA